ncbi:type II toxin-antitoxin system RelE/ParE family toxin [Pseudomonas lundensis]|uniref:type II toxin-antitoxin system RelE/ParE family toxin n=1 Tax=Pseudomonas lundensis TaxID=86185 RepID=UPI00147284F5|nr:type II toxin-antitoxin system RelE/ParE family toxin [Pseudomonas lundensis]
MYRVVFTPEALIQVDALEDYIANVHSPAVAARYVDALIGYCESLSTFPLRGNRLDDLMPGLRIAHYRHRTIIVFTMNIGNATLLGSR